MSKFDDLVATVDTYQSRAKDNYDRVRRLAEDMKDGFCNYLGTGHGVCVHLVPPAGAFKPVTDLNTAFSIPSRGFRPLGPILFGFAVRVTKNTDWIRLTMSCHKAGERLTVQVQGGPNYTFQLPLSEYDPSEFYELLFDHIKAQFADAIERYDRGADTHSIGFDFTEDEDETASV